MTPPRVSTHLPASAAAADDSAFARLWFGFSTARVVVGLVLTALLAGMRYLNPAASVSNWVLGMCSAYFLAALAARLLLRPVRPGQTFDPQWVSSIGIDLVVFSALQFANAGGIYFPPLFAGPVLMASPPTACRWRSATQCAASGTRRWAPRATSWSAN